MDEKEWTLADVAIFPTPGKDGVTVRHLHTGRAVHIDNVEINSEIIRGAPVMPGFQADRRNAAAVRLAWRQVSERESDR